MGISERRREIKRRRQRRLKRLKQHVGGSSSEKGPGMSQGAPKAKKEAEEEE